MSNFEIAEVAVCQTPDGATFPIRKDAERHLVRLAIDHRIDRYLARLEVGDRGKSRAGACLRRFLLWESGLDEEVPPCRET
ncbi:hypothetical protein JCM19379_22840 [Methyloparacoccus murrellii]